MTTRDRDGTEVLTPTESRQASPRTMNLRVLVYSMAVLAVVGAALLAAFWFETPSQLDEPQGPATVETPATPPAASPAPAPSTNP